jgi:hypothetical protein
MAPCDPLCGFEPQTLGRNHPECLTLALSMQLADPQLPTVSNSCCESPTVRGVLSVKLPEQTTALRLTYCASTAPIIYLMYIQAEAKLLVLQACHIASLAAAGQAGQVTCPPEHAEMRHRHQSSTKAQSSSRLALCHRGAKECWQLISALIAPGMCYSQLVAPTTNLHSLLLSTSLR